MSSIWALAFSSVVRLVTCLNWINSILHRQDFSRYKTSTMIRFWSQSKGSMEGSNFRRHYISCWWFWNWRAQMCYLWIGLKLNILYLYEKSVSYSLRPSIFQPSLTKVIVWPTYLQSSFKPFFASKSFEKISYASRNPTYTYSILVHKFGVEF